MGIQCNFMLSLVVLTILSLESIRLEYTFFWMSQPQVLYTAQGHELIRINRSLSITLTLFKIYLCGILVMWIKGQNQAQR